MAAPYVYSNLSLFVSEESRQTVNKLRGTITRQAVGKEYFWGFKVDFLEHPFGARKLRLETLLPEFQVDNLEATIEYSVLDVTGTSDWDVVIRPVSINGVALAAEAAVFDVTKAQIGDNIGDFTIVTIEPFFKQRPLASDNAKVVFSGQVVVKGEYVYTSDEDDALSGSESVCMHSLDEISRKRIPNIGGFDYDGFCFVNTEQAKTALGIGPQSTRGLAAIRIANYLIQSAPTEVTNQADFIDIVKQQ